MTEPFDPPAERPVGLRRPRAISVTLTRVDSGDPAGWSWGGFPEPFHRFDPLSGSFRPLRGLDTEDFTSGTLP